LKIELLFRVALFFMQEKCEIAHLNLLFKKCVQNCIKKLYNKNKHKMLDKVGRLVVNFGQKVKINKTKKERKVCQILKHQAAEMKRM
jgi:hypothetical protein